MATRLSNGQFPKGRSGNPKGRPKSATVELRKQLESRGAELVDVLIKQAPAGDGTAIKVCMDRLYPSLKPQPAPIRVDLKGCEGLAGVSRRLIDSAAAGDIPADVASQLVGALGQVARIQEVDELTKRIEALEESNA